MKTNTTAPLLHEILHDLNDLALMMIEKRAYSSMKKKVENIEVKINRNIYNVR